MRGLKVYLFSREGEKNSRCTNEFTPHRLPRYLTDDPRKDSITWFLFTQACQKIPGRDRTDTAGHSMKKSAYQETED